MVNYTHVMPDAVFSNCDGFMYCMAKWVYEVTNGVAFILILGAFFVILMGATSRFGNARSYGAASIICMLASVYLAVMQLMAWWAAAFFILNGLLGFVVLVINKK